ncbi:MAG: alkaline phosphatase family protein [Candidatus Pacebacteria bacterium]|nr:alkaline phosphatase family protein [Candidatus Paceibacterota bacterium]
MKNKAVLIGLDGVPYGLVDDLANRGVMPNFQALKKQGVFAKMAAPLPAVSSVSWSSIITGQNPGVHGIYGFTDLAPQSYDLVFPNFNDLKAPAFWHKHPELKQVALNVPSTYPVKPLNGVHISGFVSPDMEQAVFPAKYLPKLAEIKYEIDVDSELAHQDMDSFLKNLFQVTEARVAAFRYFWQEVDWDVFWLVFTGSDRLGHFLFNAYRNEGHKYHGDFLRYFKRVDEVIGEIAGRLNENDSLLVFSDHGMTEAKANVNLNYFLQESGFLRLDKSSGELYNQISPQSRAFALEPGRIYLNRKGRYPNGAVEESQAEKILEELSDAFSRLDFCKQPVIERICPKERIYSGAQVANAPDLVLVEKEGFRLRAGLNKKELFDKDIFTGTHTGDDAFLFVKGSSSFVDDSLKAEDIVAIIEKTII